MAPRVVRCDVSKPLESGYVEVWNVCWGWVWGREKEESFHSCCSLFRSLKHLAYT